MDPFLVWDLYRVRYARLLMNLLEEEYEREVKVVPIPWYHRGWGAYTRAPKDVLQTILDRYRVQNAHFEDIAFTIINDKYRVKLARNSVTECARHVREEPKYLTGKSC